jgi:predicted outer membrane repeat protein
VNGELNDEIGMSNDEGMTNMRMTKNPGCYLSASLCAVWRVWRITVPLLFCAVLLSARADTITVTNANDSGPGSLRQALADANDGDTIDFAVTGTIGLTSGELLIDKSITISGPGADNLAVDGNAKSRVFFIGVGRTVTLSGLTITNGNVAIIQDNGGGIYNDHATLTLDNCRVTENLAGFGAGIFSDGVSGVAMLDLQNSAVSDNVATFSGGGIHNAGFGEGIAMLEVANSTFEGNTAPGDGGGIYNDGETGSATLQITNSTLSGNSVDGLGGGVYNDGFAEGSATLSISNSTLAANSATEGGDGIYNQGTFGSALFSIGNTILNAGALGENIFNDSGTVISLGYNLGSDDAGGLLNGSGDQVNTDPLLGSLQDNGGPTFTHELLKGSPAIDAGDPSFTPPPLFDQRGPGFDRIVNGRLDVGSFEVQGLSPTPTPTPTATPSPPPTPRPVPTPRPRPVPHPRPTLR